MESLNKPTVIIIYGAIAVGKLTVGKILAKKTGFKLTHNHLINDLVWSVFDRETPGASEITEKMRFDFYETVVKYGKSIIITHAFAYNYISSTGLSDPDYLKKLERKLSRAGATVLFVHLQADDETLLARVKEESRKEHRKLTEVSKLKNISKTNDWKTSAHVKNNLVINNTHLTPQQVVKKIMSSYLSLM